jgi:hypothetical protein
MSGPLALERGYRRLLAWYPRTFRRVHEEEILAVLLAGARPGQRRPGLAEAVNLITCGLGMRLRRGGHLRERFCQGLCADQERLFAQAGSRDR